MQCYISIMLGLDEKLFRLINNGLSCGFLDALMLIFTDERIWAPIALAFLLVLSLFGGRKGRIAALTVLVAVAIVDPVIARMIKPLIGRMRPCHELEYVRVLWNCGGMFSFPSSHAANAATFAAAIGFSHKRFLWTIVPIAFLVGFSRIYIGVHYPLDVLGGFLFGAAIGLLAAEMLQKWLGAGARKDEGARKNEKIIDNRVAGNG